MYRRPIVGLAFLFELEFKIKELDQFYGPRNRSILDLLLGFAFRRPLVTELLLLTLLLTGPNKSVTTRSASEFVYHCSDY